MDTATDTEKNEKAPKDLFGACWDAHKEMEMRARRSAKGAILFAMVKLWAIPDCAKVERIAPLSNNILSGLVDVLKMRAESIELDLQKKEVRGRYREGLEQELGMANIYIAGIPQVLEIAKEFAQPGMIVVIDHGRPRLEDPAEAIRRMAMRFGEFVVRQGINNPQTIAKIGSSFRGQIGSDKPISGKGWNGLLDWMAGKGPKPQTLLRPQLAAEPQPEAPQADNVPDTTMAKALAEAGRLDKGMQEIIDGKGVTPDTDEESSPDSVIDTDTAPAPAAKPPKAPKPPKKGNGKPDIKAQSQQEGRRDRREMNA